MAAERDVEEIETVMETWRLRAPISGLVTDVKAHAGAVLQPGQSVLGIGAGEEGLDVLVYVPSAEGKRVETGMPVLISPTTVRSAEYGYMTGAVASLSEFPASVDSMAAALQNQDLAEAFWSDGAPYAGRIALTPGSRYRQRPRLDIGQGRGGQRHRRHAGRDRYRGRFSTAHLAGGADDQGMAGLLSPRRRPADRQGLPAPSAPPLPAVTGGPDAAVRQTRPERGAPEPGPRPSGLHRGQRLQRGSGPKSDTHPTLALSTRAGPGS